MTDASIGYYAHHQGAGHVTRALAIAAHLPGPVTLFGSSLPENDIPTNVSVCRLPIDFDKDTFPDSTFEPFYAPLNVRGLRERMKMLVDWFCDASPCLLVVDVSVEVALLARFCGIPTVYIRQRGARFDEAHSLAYASARRLLAPYPIEFEQPDAPAVWTAKTDYSGLISRYEGVVATRPRVEKLVTVITGHGGTAITLARLAIAARLCDDWQWAVLGPIAPDDAVSLPVNLHLHGVLDDPLPWLSKASVVIGSAGDGVVSEIAALRCRFICIPEARPFGEQQATARVLDAAKLAISLSAWPPAQEWPSLLIRAERLRASAWDRYATDRGAERAARFIMQTAEANLP
ncbi:glycosyltransferase family 28 protein [Caballeronia insecticola]|uniref:hypothetical protein n=1 Tax=Caballeronia insecticola TaxID=758793 RepID=UPI0005C44602|nr:hypothetical protein [Caballeronia insecticola]